MKKILITITIFFLAISSCTKSDNLKYNCIDKKLNITFSKRYNDFIFFDTLFKIENKLIENKIFKNNTKEFYISFINNLDTTKTSKMKNYLDEINSYSDFYNEMSDYGSVAIKECCECKCVDRDIKRKKLYDSLYSNDIPKSFLNKLIDLTDFKNDYERVILLNFIYLYIYEVFEEHNYPEINW